MNNSIKEEIEKTRDDIGKLQKKLMELCQQNSGLFIGEKYYELYDDYELETVFLGYLQESEAEEWKENTENSGEHNLFNVRIFQVSREEYELRQSIDKLEKAEDLLRDIRHPYDNQIKACADALTKLGNEWRAALKNRKTINWVHTEDERIKKVVAPDGTVFIQDKDGQGWSPL